MATVLFPPKTKEKKKLLQWAVLSSLSLRLAPESLLLLNTVNFLTIKHCWIHFKPYLDFSLGMCFALKFEHNYMWYIYIYRIHNETLLDRILSWLGWDFKEINRVRGLRFCIMYETTIYFYLYTYGTYK